MSNRITHKEFIEKMALYKKAVDLKSDGKTTDEIRNALGIRNPAQAIDYHERHKDDAVQPAFGSMAHEAVLEMAQYFPIHDIDSIKQSLISKYAVDLDAKIKPRTGHRIDVPKRISRKLLTASGLEWGELDGNVIVHWKHFQKPA